jgi:hypothetical protein
MNVDVELRALLRRGAGEDAVGLILAKGANPNATDTVHSFLMVYADVH